MTTMVPFRLCAALLAALAVTSCATTANYEKILQSWVGNSEDHLVESWGPPQRSYALSDGGKSHRVCPTGEPNNGRIYAICSHDDLIITVMLIVTVVMVVMPTAITQEQARKWLRMEPPKIGGYGMHDVVFSLGGGCFAPG